MRQEKVEEDMKVKITAPKTIGFGCVKGESKTYEVQKIEDRGSYYNLVIHSNREVKVKKDNWNIEIL